MPRKKRHNPRRRKTSSWKNTQARVADFFGWPWFAGWDMRRIFRQLLILGFWGCILLLIAVFILSLGLPDIRKAVDMDHRPTVIMRDRNGAEFAREGDIQGDILRLDEISPWVPKAVIAVEDRRFYSHWGVDPIGLARAMWANMRSGSVVQGGSTLTQQLAKNLFLSPDRTLTRKVKEALLALYLEQRYTKNEILTAYLNRAYFGAGAYGVDSAARVYFRTSARNLNVEQAAMLAGLLKAPSRYSPDNDPKLTTKRTRVVLGAMVDAGYLKPGAEKMKLQPLPAREYAASGSAAAHYFADWVMSQVESYIGTPTQNLIIDTTLDSSLQNFSATVMRDTLEKEGPAKNITQGAAIIMQPDGAIITMIGGRDYDESQYNRAVAAMRQPGSSFKPVIYIAALEAGYTPETQVLDAPLNINGYKPENFDGKYRGYLRLQDAVAQSLNTVAVRTLHDVGISRAKNVAQRLGITEPLTSDLSLALGASEVHVLSLTTAYATIANRGMSVEPFGIRSIKTEKGQVLYERRAVPATPVLDPRIVSEIDQILQAVILYGTGQGAMIDRPAAGKTGTTSNHRDAWFMGYTADLVGGVWVGNDDNSMMKRVTGGAIPARIWHSIMLAAHRGIPVKPLPTMASGSYDVYPTSPEQAPQQQPSGPSLFDNLLQNILGNDNKPAGARKLTPAPNAPADNSTINWD